MHHLKIVYVDDEFPALELLKRYCKNIDEVGSIITFQDPVKALQYLSNNQVDLLVLDVNMPVLNGIQLLENLQEKPLCIFLTQENKYAVKAFELDVVHYLVKPVDFETFEKAIRKAMHFLQFKQNTLVEKMPNFIMFKSNYIIQKVLLKDILWVEGFGEYITIVTHLKKYMLLDRMTNFVNKFQYLGFLRIHKSYIILSQHINSYDAKFVYLNHDNKLPLGRTYKNSVIKHLSQ